MTRKTPIKHRVSKFKKKNGTIVKDYIRGKGIKINITNPNIHKTLTYNYDKELMDIYLPLENTSTKSGKLIFMSPKQFLEKCPTTNIFDSNEERKYKNAYVTPLNDGYNKTKVETYIKKLKSGEQIDVPHLDYRKNPFLKNWAGHDGRHRAKAALILGIKKIPVIILEDKK